MLNNNFITLKISNGFTFTFTYAFSFLYTYFTACLYIVCCTMYGVRCTHRYSRELDHNYFIVRASRIDPKQTYTSGGGVWRGRDDRRVGDPMTQ